jgi:hypothetical protein
MSKEQRSKVMKEAATRRWEKQRKEAAKAARAAAKAAPVKKKAPAPKEFSSALKTAEKRLAKAILERAEAAAKYAVLSAEIPSLQRIIQALRNPAGDPFSQGYGVQGYPAVAPPTLEQIVGGEPIAYQNPPLRRGIAAEQEPLPPIPQNLHPANVQGRAQGGAIDVVIPDTEDEDKFLRESGVAGGEWH